jgi:hypothetical protein
MTEQEKSLKLAELMGWRLRQRDCSDHYSTRGIASNYKYTVLFPGVRMCPDLQPYEGNQHGLAQFAAILLKFPEAMTSYGMKCDGSVYLCDSPDDCPPTQSNILDEILRMNGVDV